MTSPPLVSVLLCTYNGSNYLPAQLDSLISQTYGNFEVVALDDCSSDDTFEILKKYEAEHPSFRVYKNEMNTGYEKNFNAICLLARGEFIAFADQDDIWHPDKIRIMMENRKEGLNLIYCNSQRFRGTLSPPNIESPRNYRRFHGTDGKRLALYNTISGHATIIKRDFLRLIHPFPSGLFYDWWAGMVAAYNGGVGYVDVVLVYQRIHEKNVSISPPGLEKERSFRIKEKETKGKHLNSFCLVPNLPVRDREFFEKLNRLWNHARSDRFNFRLFFFLLFHRSVIFCSKKRMVGIFTHIKHSFRWSRTI